MSQASPSNTDEQLAQADQRSARILLKSYPKIVFLYPTFLTALVSAVIMSFGSQPLVPDNGSATSIAIAFLVVLSLNLVVLSYDFPRTTSLTLFFFLAAVALGISLLFVWKPDLLPSVTAFIKKFHPLANATFYWTVTVVLGILLLFSFSVVHFDYWEVRPNELLHHHGLLSNLERFAAPNLRIDKEINDVFEYLLLQSGRLILHPSGEPRAIILDNVPFISRKETAIMGMLGALQVQVRTSTGRD